VLSVSFGSDPGYLTRHVEEHTSAERGNYYLSAAEHGEPPGQWFGQGAEALGLTGQVDKDVMLPLYQNLVHPTSGEALGSRPYRYKDTPERVADAIAAEGGEVGPERRAEIELAVRKDHREARNYADATFSMPKSWSVLHTALESQGRHGEAEQLWQAWMDGVKAGVGYLQENAGYSRAGRHGTKVAGRTSGRWVEAPDWVMSTWRHHVSREGDPQLHVHVAILNRVECEDGKWRALDGQAILRARPAAGAIAERVAEESATQRLGVSFAMRPDGKSREIVGVDESIRDAWSARRRAVSARVSELAQAYETKYGRSPNAYVMWKMSQHATVETRKAKPDHPPTRAELLERWEAEASQVLRGGLASVVAAADVGNDRDIAGEAFDPARVIAGALWEVQQDRASWTRHDLIAGINRQLPDCLGGLTAVQAQTLVEDLTNQALAPGGEAVRLTAPELVPAPDELRRADGRSIYEPPQADRYATTWHLRAEETVLAAARRADGPRVELEEASRYVDASRLSPSQAVAVTQLLTSGREVEPFEAAAGTGKSFTMAAFADIWTHATGTPALGLTTSERARQVLEDEGFKRSANISRWLAAQDRIAAGRAQPYDADYEFVAGQVIVVDEASMVSTQHLAAIQARAATVGAKVVLIGDTRQLGAVGAGGLFKTITEEVDAVRLDEVRRFDHTWEADASLRLRGGEVDALSEYDRRGRIRDGSRSEMITAATRGAVANRLRGDTSLLVVSTNELAAEISSEVRAELVRLGRVTEDGAVLADGNQAGVGDMIMTRENDYNTTTATGAAVINRNVYEVVSRTTDGRLEVRTADRGELVTLSADYVAEHVELAYAATVHAGQGVTVAAGAQLVDENTTAAGLYVGASRGADRNNFYVITHDDAEPEANRPDRMAVLANVMERSEPNASAVETMRDELSGAENLARLEPIWADLIEERTAAETRQDLEAALGSEVANQISTGSDIAKVTALLRQAELAGFDRHRVIEEVTRRELDSARSPGDVLAWRIERHIGDGTPVKTSYVARTPESTDAKSTYARQLAEEMDRKVGELGERAAAERPQWAEALGPVPVEADKAAEWAERAGSVAAYREAHGYQNTRDPIGPAPLARNAEARAAWEQAYEALGRPEEHREIAKATDAELQSHVEADRREQAWAPPYVDNEMRERSLDMEHLSTELSISEAEAEAAARSGQAPDDAAERLHNERAAFYKLAADVAALEEVSESRRAWYDETRQVRERAAAARRELEARHRGTPDEPADAPEPQEPTHEESVTVAAKERDRSEPEREVSVDGPDRAEPEHAEPEPADVDEPERAKDPAPAAATDIDAALIKAREAMAEVDRRHAARDAERERQAERLDHEHVQSVDRTESIEHDQPGESGTL
jgi:conjugative relaxase-like TrwC/TraI family protein